MQTLYDRGEIEFRDYSGLYCIGCERYLTERELTDGKCEQHRTEPEQRSEANYFFKMTQHFDWLTEVLEQQPELVTPARYRKEVQGVLRQGALGDLCITRPKTRLTCQLAKARNVQRTTSGSLRIGRKNRGSRDMGIQDSVRRTLGSTQDMSMNARKSIVPNARSIAGGPRTTMPYRR